MDILKRFGAIVLAAGSSSRMGSPKQLLSYQHKSLLDIAIEAAVNAVQGSVVVILGGNYNLIAGKVGNNNLTVVRNQDWEKGIGTSISLGMSVIMAKEMALDGVILMVCDQPFINAAQLKALMLKEQMSGKGIVASAYSETLGVPSLFSNQYFNELTTLNGEEGAKKLILKYKNDLATVPFINGEIDIDTPADYEKLISAHLANEK